MEEAQFPETPFTDRNPRLPWRGAHKAFAQQAHNGDLTRHHSHYPPRAGHSVAYFSLAAAREVASVVSNK